MALDRLTFSDGEGGVAHHLDVRVHPEDRRATGETDLALVCGKGHNDDPALRNTRRYSARQLARIRSAAGENVAPITDGGVRVGSVYGIRADLLIDGGEVVVNTKTVDRSGLSVRPDADGRDIRARIDVVTRAAAELRRVVEASETLEKAG